MLMFSEIISFTLNGLIRMFKLQTYKYYGTYYYYFFVFQAKITVEGSYQELQRSGLDFTKLLGSSTETAVLTENACNIEKSNIESSELHSANTAQKSSVSIVASSVKETEINDVDAGPVNMAETRSSGNVGFSIYSSYIFAGGHFCKVLSLLSVCIFTQVIASGSDYWITYW